MRKWNLSLRARGWAAILILAAPAMATAATFRKEASIVELVGQSELILHGRVKELTDGIDELGIPYTQVTLRVAEAVKGQAGKEYTFRQFGLLKPRRMPDGRTNLMVTPSGWAKYALGEEAILFLNKPAAWTGLQTTSALGQGKFTVRVAGAVNTVNNTGLFQGVTADPTLLGETDKRVLSTQKGAVNAKAFLALVRQAVKGEWVEKGMMRHAK